ncbi:MAG TPA: hypothetical protein VG637_00730 [Actinomycetes bacterium]|nr:hypothetical protein [Actinomycetes bacterium]
MAETNTVARTVRDLGLANWFGGSLMGAVGLNGSAGAVSDPQQRSRVPRAGWQRWTPLEAAGILAVVAGDTVLIASRPQHLAAQHGYARNLAIKLAINGAAVAATAGTWLLGRRLDQAGEVPVEGATEPGPDTPPQAAGAQRGLRVLQWAVPALTGAHIAMNVLLAEQERPRVVAQGVVRRGRGLLGRLAIPALAGAAATAAKRRGR